MDSNTVSGEGAASPGNDDIGTAEPELNTMAEGNMPALNAEANATTPYGAPAEANATTPYGAPAEANATTPYGAPTEETTTTTPYGPPTTETAATEVTKSGVVLSNKQSAVVSERKELYKRMVNSYAEKFAGQKKAPKAKMTDAAHILKEMRLAGEKARSGAEAAGAGPEEAAEAGMDARNKAYELTIMDVMDRNETSSKVKTLKGKKTPMNTTQKNVNRPSLTQNMRLNSGQIEPLLASFDTMMETAKGVITTMGNMSKALVRQLAKTDNVTGINQVAQMANTGLSRNTSMMNNFNSMKKPLPMLGPRNTASRINNSLVLTARNNSLGLSAATANAAANAAMNRNIGLLANNSGLLPMSSAKPKTKRRVRSGRTSRKARKGAATNNLPSLSRIVEEEPNNFTNI